MNRLVIRLEDNATGRLRDNPNVNVVHDRLVIELDRFGTKRGHASTRALAARVIE
jgi:hypothetical protein